MTSQAIDVHEELADARVSAFHWRLGAIMGLLTLFDGYDTFNPAYVIHYVAGPWGLKAGQAGLLISSGLVGFLLGAALHGVAADRFGRRGTLLAGLWITSVFTLLTAAFADSFVALRLAAIDRNGPWRAAAARDHLYQRTRAAPRCQHFRAVGRCAGLGRRRHAGRDCRRLRHAVMGWAEPLLDWIALVSAAAVHACELPELPKFLAIQGRVAEIRHMLARLRPERADIYATATIAAEPNQASGNLILELLQPRYRRTTLAIWVTAFLSLFCIFGLSGWIPTVMIQRGETFATSFGFGALMQIMSFVGGIVLGHLVDRFGRSRGLLGLWWGLGGCAVLTLVFLNDHLVNVSCVAAAGFFIIGAMFVLNNFTAASYPTNVRATAVGMELGVGRVGAILGPFVAGALQQTYQSSLPMFISIGAAALSAGAIIQLARRSSVKAGIEPLAEPGTA